MNCRPDYDFFGDGHVICKAKCNRSISSKILNPRSGEEVILKGCPEILQMFYMREIWLRVMGIQKTGEQTRNFMAIALKGKVVEELSKISDYKKGGGERNEPPRLS